MDEPKETTTDFEAAYKAGMEVGYPKILTEDKPQYIIVPKEAQLKSLETLLPRPLSKRGEIELTTPTDFIAYVNTHKTSSTLILQGAGVGADHPLAFPFFKAIFDYHEGKENGEKGWGDHIATLRLRPSAEWIAWADKEKDTFTHVELAEFIEDHFSDFLEPAAGDMLSIATRFQADIKESFSSVHRLDNGSYSLQSSSDVTAKVGGNINIPAVFRIRIPLFEDASLTEISCRFRFRKSPSGLAFIYSFIEPALLFREQRNNIRELLETDININILRGSQIKTSRSYHV